MALAIVASVCIGCTACETVCPTGAVVATGKEVRIEKTVCCECRGFFDRPQCASICPIEGAIRDGDGADVNPPGSLGGRG